MDIQEKVDGGRLRLDDELVALIVRFAGENSRMGYGKIQGELLKLGYQVDATTIRNVLRRHHIAPAPKRRQSSWRTFLGHYKQQMLACDFFIIETITLQTRYVLFFIEIGSRRVHLAGCTTTPDNAWVTQQARQFTWILSENPHDEMCYLIHDRDTKFTRAFETVFQTKGIESVRTLSHAASQCFCRTLGAFSSSRMLGSFVDPEPTASETRPYGIY